MRRLLATLSAAVLTAAFLCPLPAAGRADPTRSEAWQAVAERAYDRLTVLDTGSQTSMTLAYAAQSAAWLSPQGWADPDALAYLARLRATRNPDGGYGVGKAWDAHGDGTVNPATTSYVVTMAGHVGPVLLDAYRAGVVPRADVQQLLDLVAAAPRIDTTAGRCVAYSMSANDAKPGLCTHNVNAGAAWFLLEAGASGFAVQWWLVQGITKRELSAYNATTRSWPYRDNLAPAPQDRDHNSYSAESVYALAYPVGYSSAVYAMGASDGDPDTPIAYMRLTGLPATPTAMSGSTTVWCVLGDSRLDDADGFVTHYWADIGRLSQAAYYAARASRACA